MFYVHIVPRAFSYLINYNNDNSNWKKLLGFRNMQEMLENSFFQSLYDMHYYSLLSGQFGYGISSMVGLIKQDFWPNINIIKENY